MLNRFCIALVLNWMGTRHRPICKVKVLQSVLGRKRNGIWTLRQSSSVSWTTTDGTSGTPHNIRTNEFHDFFQTQSNIGALSSAKRRNDVGSARGSCDREDRPQVYIVVPCFHDITHHERCQSMIGWGALCSLSCLSAKIRQECVTIIWRSDHRNRQKYCVVQTQH